MASAECGVVEQQSNEGTKLSGLVAWFLGCSKEFPSAGIRFPSLPSLVRAPRAHSALRENSPAIHGWDS
jgi:hypothetical protein